MRKLAKFVYSVWYNIACSSQGQLYQYSEVQLIIDYLFCEIDMIEKIPDEAERFLPREYIFSCLFTHEEHWLKQMCQSECVSNI